MNLFANLLQIEQPAEGGTHIIKGFKTACKQKVQITWLSFIMAKLIEISHVIMTKHSDTSPNQLPQNALIKALPISIQRFIAKFFVTRALAWILAIIFTLFVGTTSAWLLMALWTHQPFGGLGTKIFMVFWGCLALSLTGFFITRAIFRRRTDLAIYVLCFGVSLAWYFGMDAKNDRIWHDEVANILNYKRQDDIITVNNIRHFNWHKDGTYDIHWESRQYDLKELESYDIIISDWGLNKIVHVMASFGFKNGEKLSFSIEIRKESHESFSAIGGFFRQFELGLVAGDEKDLLYSRTNIRGEDVYIYPVNLSQESVQELFLLYLQKGENLNHEARWYNTLTSNCTTLIFDMMSEIEPIPIDYRALLAGLLPEYLHDENAINTKYSVNEWRQMAHINPYTKNININAMTSQAFSRHIRQGLPNFEK